MEVLSEREDSVPTSATTSWLPSICHDATNSFYGDTVGAQGVSRFFASTTIIGYNCMFLQGAVSKGASPNSIGCEYGGEPESRYICRSTFKRYPDSKHIDILITVVGRGPQV